MFVGQANDWLRLSTGEANPISRRQDLPPAYHRDGSVYVTRRDVLMLDNSLFGKYVCGYRLDPADCVTIDNLDDWDRADLMLRARKSQHVECSIDLSATRKWAGY